MSRKFADNAPRPMDEPPPDDRQLELLKEVLSATFDAKRPANETTKSRYRPVVDRWRGTPWNVQTIGVALVREALRDWLASVQLSDSAQDQLIRDVAHALCADPSSAAKLRACWQELQEPQG